MTIERIPRWLQATLLALSVVFILEALGAYAALAIGWPFVNPTLSTPADMVTLAVPPGSAAQRAGVRTGDRLDFPQMTTLERFHVNDNTWVGGAEARLAVTRNGVPLTARFRLEPLPRTLLNLASQYLGIAFSLFAFIVGTIVIARRPTVDAALFWGFVFGGWSALYAPFAPVPLAMAIQFIADVVYVWWLGPMVLLAVGPRPIRKRLLSIVLGLWLLWGLGVLACDLGVVFAGLTPPPFVQWLIATLAINYISYALCIVAVIAGIVQSRGALRVRYQWMSAGFAAYLAATICMSLIAVSGEFFSGPLNFIRQILFVIGICIFAYTIVRHDLYGIGFVVNRAAIFTALTAVIVGLFAACNWIVGNALKTSGLALPIDVVLAAAAGLSLNLVQRRVTVVVDRLFFRRRYDATRRLRRVARALAQVDEGGLVADALVVEPADALQLEAAAYFARRLDGTFELVTQQNWPVDASAIVDARDRFVLHLMGASDEPQSMDDLPFSQNFPDGAARPRTVVPLWSGRELRGFALYSAHRSGATLDPEETATLERLAVAANAAIDRIAAAELQSALDEVATLRAENERLRQPGRFTVPIPLPEA